MATCITQLGGTQRDRARRGVRENQERGVGTPSPFPGDRCVFGRQKGRISRTRRTPQLEVTTSASHDKEVHQMSTARRRDRRQRNKRSRRSVGKSLFFLFFFLIFFLFFFFFFSFFFFFFFSFVSPFLFFFFVFFFFFFGQVRGRWHRQDQADPVTKSQLTPEQTWRYGRKLRALVKRWADFRP